MVVCCRFTRSMGSRSAGCALDRGTEYCGVRDPSVRALPGDRKKSITRARDENPQANGICERFDKTLLDEFHRITFRKTRYRSLEQLHGDLDEFRNPRQNPWCLGRIRLAGWAQRNGDSVRSQVVAVVDYFDAHIGSALSHATRSCSSHWDTERTSRNDTIL
jgi:hypothetical protein